MIHIFFQSMIRIIKRDKNYILDSNLSLLNLINEGWYRLVCLLRGSFTSLFYKKIHILFFKGQNVKIRFKNNIKIGRGTIIEDNVFIDAMSLNGIKIGNNVTIVRDTIIKCTGIINNLGVGLVIGNNSAIGAMSFINAQGGIKIGNDVIIGPGIKIFSENHNFDQENIKIRLQGVNRKELG